MADSFERQLIEIKLALVTMASEVEKYLDGTLEAFLSRNLVLTNGFFLIAHSLRQIGNLGTNIAEQILSFVEGNIWKTGQEITERKNKI